MQNRGDARGEGCYSAYMVPSEQRKTWKKLWFRGLIAASVLRCTPFVRFVGLNGSLATGTYHQGSDIDFYIAAVPGRIYLARACSLVAMQLLGIRRRGELVAGRVCLNRFATTSFLEITPHDTYHARVFHNTFPLYAAPGVYEKFITENRWMSDFSFTPVVHQVVLRDTLISKAVQLVFEAILYPFAQIIEKQLTRFQYNRFARDERLLSGENIVVLTPQELRFHLDKNIHGPA